MAAGGALGVASFLAAQLLPHPANLLGTLGAPWLAVAFAVGSFAPSRPSSAWAGAASMAAAVAAYYVAREVAHPAAPGGLLIRGEVVRYLAIGLLAGAAFAVAGHAWRRGGFLTRGIAAGLLAGALGAEVIVLSVRSWSGSELAFALIQGAAALAVALLLPDSRTSRGVALAV
ncbi:MAG TPA: DUF6518 family protein, partial [Actinomycetota bacterium]|nr:DUF6518 family protein [Actinomycetota bacterium]